MGDKYCQKWCPVFQGLINQAYDTTKTNTIYRGYRYRRHNVLCIYDPRVLDRSLYALLINATEVIGDVADNMYSDSHLQWQREMFGHSFSVSRAGCTGPEAGTVVSVVRNWLHTHEEAQVMVASILVVVGLWWLVRAVLTLLINLVCPLLVVVLAVVCVPQLRAPLLGQNYPLLANLLRSILLKMAENIKT